jgi:hypothetical protein
MKIHEGLVLKDKKMYEEKFKRHALYMRENDEDNYYTSGLFTLLI